MNDSSRPHRWPWIAGILLLAVSAVGATWALNQNGPSAGKPTVKADPAIPPGVVCLGYVDVDPGVAQLHPLQQGRIVWVEKEGAEVAKGDPLLKLEDKLPIAKVNEAKADLDNAKKQLEKAQQLPQQHKLKLEEQGKGIKAAEASRDAAQAEYEVKKDITKAQAVLDGYAAMVKKLDAIVEVEKLKLQELSLFDPELDIARAEADVAGKQAQLDQANVGVQETVLKAPTDGLLLRMSVQPGEVLGGNPKFAAIQFAPKGPRIVRAEVLQEWASKVQPGQTVTIEDDTYMGAKWEGKVTRISNYFAQKRSPVIEPFMFNDVRTLECIVEITSPSADLRIGQRVRARIKTGG